MGVKSLQLRIQYPFIFFLYSCKSIYEMKDNVQIRPMFFNLSVGAYMLSKTKDQSRKIKRKIPTYHSSENVTISFSFFIISLGTGSNFQKNLKDLGA